MEISSFEDFKCIGFLIAGSRSSNPKNEVNSLNLTTLASYLQEKRIYFLLFLWVFLLSA
jgi:hypothetical protein